MARTQDVIVEEIADEAIVYDRKSKKAHCLNKAASVIWRHCDGRTDIGSLARLLPAECNLPEDPALVLLALQELKNAGLLASATTRSRRGRHQMTRRHALVGAAGMSAAPAVRSILAPTPAMAASGGTHQDNQDQNGDNQDGAHGTRRKFLKRDLI